MEVDIGEELLKDEQQREAENEWLDPILITDYSQLPEFPSEVLPGVGRDIVENVAEVNQVDAGLTGSIYLSVLATCTAKKAEVDLITHREPLNIFTCSVLDSGERKTSTMSIMTAPLYEYQKNKTEEMADEIRQSFNRYKINEARLTKLQKRAAHEDSEVNRIKLKQEAAELMKEMAEDPLIKPPLIAVDDITNEALGINMAENNERIAIFSAEGGIFGIIAGRYHEKGENFDIYLKGHAGDPWSSHRVGREQKHMTSPALTMCLAVQHDVIKEIGGHRSFRGRGLTARFLYSICRSQIGLRNRQHKFVDEALLKRYHEHIESLMDLPLEFHTFKLEKEAQRVWDDFYNEIEGDMLPGKPLEPIKDWGSKLPGAVARIAGLLHYSKHKSEAVEKSISVNSVNAACVIGAYYREHALSAFGLMQENPRIESAKRILEYITQHKPKSFKGRDVLRYKSALKTMEDVLPGLKILVERQYIRESSSGYSGMGRPEAISYEVNPKTL